MVSDPTSCGFTDSPLFSFSSVSGPVEADPEYKLIVAANNLTVEIENELSESTRFISDCVSICYRNLFALRYV